MELVSFAAGLAETAETLRYIVPLAAGLAGVFGIASMFFVIFIRKH